MSIILRQTFATTRWNKVIQLPISTKQVKLIHVSKCLVKSQEDTKGQVSPASNQKGAELSTSFAKKAKENVKTASYGSVIIIGVGVTAVVIYTIYKELFSLDSPQGLYTMASDQCMNHPKVQDLLGEPIKAFGEESRRGRRRHVRQLRYQDDQGRSGLRVQFHLQGLRHRGLAEVDAREDDNGNMKTRYIIVTTEDMYRRTIVVEDNR